MPPSIDFKARSTARVWYRHAGHFVMVTVLCVSAWSCVGTSGHYQRAVKFFEAGQYDEAAAAYEAFLADHETHELAPGAQLALAHIAFLQDDFDLATERLDEADVTDSLLKAWMDWLRCQAFLSLGAVSQAQQSLDALAQCPHANVWEEDIAWFQCTIWAAGESKPEAIEGFKSFITERPTSHRIAHAKWYLLHLQPDIPIPKRLDAYQRLLSENPSVATRALIFASIADLRSESGEWRGAIRGYRKALTLQPSARLRPEVLYRLAQAFDAIGNTTVAVRHYRQLIDEYPEHRRVLEAQEAIATLDETAPPTEAALVRLAPRSLPEVTNVRDVVAEGFALAGTSVLVNGDSVQLEDGRFTQAITLTEGANTIRVEASRSDGEVQIITRYVELDTKPPTVDDFDAYLSDSGFITVEGQVDQAKTRVRVNGKRINVGDDGKFRARAMKVRLPVSQEITIRVAATDLAGNELTFEFQDRDIPDEPRGMRVVVQTADVLDVEWRRNDEPDLWGYHIFYSPPGRDERNQLNDEVLTNERFSIDGTDLQTLEAEAVGGEIELSLRALDRLGNESESSEPLRVTVTFP